jgi:flavin reductase (DIM6/NTAB) family NADH-FMN oxidoreductase RutF
MNRSAINQALAKALAYHLAGKPEEADRFARQLVEMLKREGILKREG